MQISWLGEAGIRLQTKDTVILIDPPGAVSGLKPTRQSAHIVALTREEGRETKSIGDDPFIIDTPGEYERRNVFVYGLAVPSEPGKVHFRLEAEELSLGHLGDLGHKLENGELTQFEGVDILFVPVGGKSVLNAEQATELISQIEPRVVVPIQFQSAGLRTSYDEIAKFLKSVGAKNTEAQEKIKIGKKDLPAEETQVMVLSLS